MPANDVVEVPVDDVVVGDRARASAGNLLGLETSVRRVGLLHPIVVNTRRELIAGFRRLSVAKRIGWATVPCRVVAGLDEAVSALRAELDENTCREPLTPMEIVELGRRLEALEKPKAKARKEATQAKKGERVGSVGGGNLPPPTADTGKTRDKVAGALGVSGRTYEKAKQVVESAEADPDRFGDLPAAMGQTSVDAAHREMKARREGDSKPKAEPKVPVFDVEKFNRDVARAVEVQVVGQVAATAVAAESLEAVARILMERAAELRRGE